MAKQKNKFGIASDKNATKGSTASFARSTKTSCLTSLEIHDRLKSCGMNPTLQRIEIARYVLCEANHPSAEDVFNWAKEHLSKISLATIYNTLSALKDAGLVREYRMPHSDKVIYDCNTSDHHHFFDEVESRLVDLMPEHLKVKVSLPPEILVQGLDVFVRGSIRKRV